MIRALALAGGVSLAVSALIGLVALVGGLAAGMATAGVVFGLTVIVATIAGGRAGDPPDPAAVCPCAAHVRLRQGAAVEAALLAGRDERSA